MTTGSPNAARLAGLTTSLAGRYRLERELGAGGMATVWLAEDLRHERRVAIKVLHPELSAVLGPERFLVEIKTTASLQHPHILPLFDSGSADGLLYYVMPYVEGETLRGRLDRERQLPVPDAVRIAAEVADALAYAHAHGVIHRDVKPENVLLRDGRAVVADFGIALAVRQAGGQRMTQTGLSLGTPQYMAPEQAMGERGVDARADVYALGAVTYEMLAGEPPFTGPSAQAVLARVMTEAPRPLAAQRPSVPPHVDAAVRTALEKLPADRFASAMAFAGALAQPATAQATTGQAVPRVVAPDAAARSRLAPLALGAAFTGLAAVAAWGWLRPPPPRAERPVRFTLALPDSAALASSAAEASMVFTPDGSSLVYVGGPARSVWVRPLDSLAARELPGTEGSEMPKVSPDGRWVGFLTSANVLSKVALTGGAVSTIAPRVARFAWTGPDSLVVAGMPHPGDTLWRVGADGGAPRRIATSASSRVMWQTQPTALPGGRAVLFTRFDSAGTPEIVALRLKDERIVPLGIRGTTPVFVPGGFLLYVGATDVARRGRPRGTVSAVAFDPEALRVSGAPRDVLDDVMLKPGGAELAVSVDGMLAYVPGAFGGRVLQADRAGATRVVLGEVQAYRDPRVSPDGRRIAVNIGEPGTSLWHIWVYDIASATMTRLTTRGRNMYPRWSLDGRRVAWSSSGAGLALGSWWQPADASAPPERLAPGFGVEFVPGGGGVLTNVRGDDSSDLRLLPLPPGPAEAGRPILAAGMRGLAARVSPDGRWLAYVDVQNGVDEVYLRPFPGPGGRYQISSGGGVEPAWAPDGRTLFYRGGAQLMAASLSTTPEPSVVRRDTLFPMEAQGSGPVAAYDVTPDGEHFVFARYGGVARPPVVVVGWAEQLRRRFAGRR
jgi:serine/threonine-protein kinase